MQPGLMRAVDAMLEAFRRGDEGADAKAPEERNVRCLGEFYAALGRGDWNAALALISDDCCYAIYSGGESPFRMAGRGRAEVEEGVRRNFGVLTFEAIAFESLVAQGELIMAAFRQRGHWRHNGEEFDERAVVEFRFRDGRICSYRGWLMPYLP